MHVCMNVCCSKKNTATWVAGERKTNSVEAYCSYMYTFLSIMTQQINFIKGTFVLILFQT